MRKANFLPADRMVWQFNPVLVNTGAELILFETGNGPEGRAFGLRTSRPTGATAAVTFGSANRSI